MEIGMPGGSTGWGGAADEQHKDVLARLIHRRDVEGVRRRRSERDRFRETRWNTVQKMKPGDCPACYLTGVSRWIGVLELHPSRSWMQPIWKDEVFLCRVRVRPSWKR